MAITDGSLDGSGEPARQAYAITPSDDTDLDILPRAIYIGGAGNMKVDMHSSGTAITFVGLLAGQIIPIRTSRVYATDTTATSLVALY